MKKYLLLMIGFCLSFISLDLVAQNSLAVTVFEDIDGNGLQDVGEFTIPGVTTAELRLWQDIDNNGAISAADVLWIHDNGGAVYTFGAGGAGNELPNDNYILEYVEAGGVGSYYTTKVVNGVGTVDMDNDVDPVTNTAGFALLNNTPEMNIDLGLVIAGDIGSFVWEDSDGNGLQDVGELGIFGVNVTLLDLTLNPIMNDIDNTPLANPMTTIGSGMYSFENIPPGQYIVQFEAPVPSPNQWFATMFTTDTDATDPINDSDAENDMGGGIYQSHTIILLSNESDEENKVDAGFYQSVNIGDLVWEDLNGDGIQTPIDDTGLDGVQVRLLDDTGVQATGPDGVTLIADETTAGGGLYQFTEVPPGDYQVEFFLPAAIGGVNWYPTLFDGTHTDATDPDTDSDANTMAGPDFLKSHVITVESGETDEETRIDAGFWLPAKIGNMVFCDRNGNGIHEPAAPNPEDGVAGVTVSLLISGGPNNGNPALDANGVVLTQTTIAGGLYEFELVPPGDYILKFEFNATVPDPPYRFTFQDVVGSTEFNDSDVSGDPTLAEYGETRTITVVSQDIDHETRWDAGVYRLVDISGTVWFDAGMDQINMGEPGPGGVPMVLTEINGVYPPVNGTSSVNGEYTFLEVPPGLYTLTVTAAAFAPGGSLAGTTSCVDPISGTNDADDMVDNDDNGPDTVPGDVTTTQFQVISNCNPGPPPEIEYIDFCFEFNCANESMISAPACDQINPINTICDVITLESFCNRMPTGQSPGNQPGSLCPAGGVPNNISWFAFVAYEGNYSVIIRPTNCTDAGGGNIGVQIGLYTDCSFTETVYCNPVCSEDEVIFSSDGTSPSQIAPLVPGQTYYFFIDGCAGSVCSYDVEITGNPSPALIRPTDMCILDETGAPDCSLDNVLFCPGVDVSFQVQGVDLTVDYTWSVNTNSGGPFTGTPNPMSTDENLIINFLNPGEYEVCIDRIENGCSAATWSGSPGPICKTVIIQDIPDEDFADKTICLEDLATFNYNVFDTEDPNLDGNLGWIAPEPTPAFGTLTGTVDFNGCMYDQEFDLLQHPISNIGIVDSTICRGELPLIIDGISYNDIAFAGDLTFTLPMLLASMPNQYSCDSFININLEILDIFTGTITPDICTPDGLILEFGYDTSISTDAGFITWEWTDPLGNVLIDDIVNPNDEFDISIPTNTGNGTYTMTATITKNGVTCIVPTTIDIDFDNLSPPTPTISGSPMLICKSDSIQTYTASDFGPGVNIFNWTVTGDAEVLSGGNITDQTIEINWGPSDSGGSVSLTVEGCGVSDLATLNISFIPLLVPAFSVTPIVCQDSSSIITFSGPTTDIENYMWDFDGGSINNATGGTGPGPHEVSWTPGGVDHTITLTVIHNGGCTSKDTSAVVTVIAPLSPLPMIECNQVSNGISLTWPGVTGAVGYEVVVTSFDPSGDLHTGILSDTTFTVTGLENGETVTIDLIIMTGDACQTAIVSSTAGCIFQDCDAPTIELDAGEGPGMSVSICTADISGTFDILSDVTSGEVGTGIYSGDGIIDSVAGTFDASLANIGINNITYSFMTNDLIPCSGSESIQIEILETPIASFSTSLDTICIIDTLQITYDGTTGINSSTYSVTDGQTFNESNPMITFLQTGLQVISLTVIKDDCASIEYIDTVFIQPALEQINIDCTNQAIDSVAFGWNSIDGATGYSVVVTNADGSIDPAFITTDLTYGQGGLSPNDSISITVTVLSDSRCPVFPDTQVCYANDCPTVVVSLDTIQDICVDGFNPTIDLSALLTLTGDQAGTGDTLWSGDGVTGNQFNPNGLPEGPNTINVEYVENSCGGNNAFIIVNILQEPTASFDVTPDPICIGSTIPITFTGSNLPGQTIDWGGSDVAVTATANTNEYEATFTDSGQFDLILNIDNGTDCNATPAMATVIVENALMFEQVTCSPTDTSVTYVWTDVDCATQYEVYLSLDMGPEMFQGVQTTTTFLADNLQEGVEATIRVVAISDCACGNVESASTCETSECIQVTVDVSAMGGETDFCFASDLATIDVLANPINSTGNGSGTYSGTGVDSVSGTFDPSAAGIGTHTIYYAWTEPSGCEEEFIDSVTFTIFENPEVTAMADPIDCYEDSLTLLTIVPMNGTGPYTITSEGTDIPEMSEVMEGTYNILVTDANGCSGETSETVTIPAEPMPTITGSTELILGDSSNYSIEQSIFTGLAIDSVVWTANGTVICNEIGCFTLSNETPLVNTTYIVTVFYNNGCSVDRSIEVEVTEPNPIFTVDIPNIISPNGDGENDSWMIVTGDPEVVVSSVQIIDRWGNLVYEADGPYTPESNQTVFWDGKFGTQLLQPGVYVYSVVYTQDGRERVRNGDITIIDTRR